MNIKCYEVRGGRSGMEEAGGPVKADRQVVLLSDHIASHSYDEAKERKMFEVFHTIASGLEGTDLETEFDRKEDGEYIYMMAADGWKYWKACAKSRARSAE